MKPWIVPVALLLAATCSAAAPLPQPLVLKPSAFRHYVERFNQQDNELYRQAIPNSESWHWMERNVPLFECPDQDVELTYYFRWWTYRKQLRSTPGGFVVTEFLPSVPWAGRFNTISCAAGHHFYEGRWIADPTSRTNPGASTQTTAGWIKDPGKNQWDHDACYKPFAIFNGQKWLLWYNGRHDALEQIGVVEHPGLDLGFDEAR